jgi:hypothetical protein
MIFVIFRLTKYLMNMKLTERLNVLIQAATLSQKSGVLTLDDAVKVKSAIDVISSPLPSLRVRRRKAAFR